MRADYLTTFASRWQRGFRTLLERGHAVHQRGVSVLEHDHLRRPHLDCHRHAAAHPRHGAEPLVGPRGRPRRRLQRRSGRGGRLVPSGAPPPTAAPGGCWSRPWAMNCARRSRGRASCRCRSSRGAPSAWPDTAAMPWSGSTIRRVRSSRRPRLRRRRCPRWPGSWPRTTSRRSRIACGRWPHRAASYRYGDVQPGERPNAGWTAVFPHALAGRDTRRRGVRRPLAEEPVLGRLSRTPRVVARRSAGSSVSARPPTSSGSASRRSTWWGTTSARAAARWKTC